MKKTAIVFIILLTTTLLTIGSPHAQAQESKRLSNPAFPINVGEKMLVIPGSALLRGTSFFGRSDYSTNADFNLLHVIDLPVGTTLKRVLGDFVDQVGPNIVISLVRHRNTDPTSAITLRSFDTSGITSTNNDDFKQVVSNPISHAMLQGWSYLIVVDFPGGTNYRELAVGDLKLIYEP